jgi:hypothetical protein
VLGKRSPTSAFRFKTLADVTYQQLRDRRFNAQVERAHRNLPVGNGFRKSPFHWIGHSYIMLHELRERWNTNLLETPFRLAKLRVERSKALHKPADFMRDSLPLRCKLSINSSFGRGYER